MAPPQHGADHQGHQHGGDAGQRPTHGAGTHPGRHAVVELDDVEVQAALRPRRPSPLMRRPSEESCWTQIEVGTPQQFPSFLNRSQWTPSASVTMLGSIVPPRSRWQTRGPVESSTNGQVGESATALDTHCMVVPLTRVV